jgi:hypothetical protein
MVFGVKLYLSDPDETGISHLQTHVSREFFIK